MKLLLYSENAYSNFTPMDAVKKAHKLIGFQCFILDNRQLFFTIHGYFKTDAVGSLKVTEGIFRIIKKFIEANSKLRFFNSSQQDVKK